MRRDATIDATKNSTIPYEFYGGGHSHSLQYSCLGECYGQRSIVGYSPQGHKESDTTEAT